MSLVIVTHSSEGRKVYQDEFSNVTCQDESSNCYTHRSKERKVNQDEVISVTNNKVDFTKMSLVIVIQCTEKRQEE